MTCSLNRKEPRAKLTDRSRHTRRQSICPSCACRVYSLHAATARPRRLREAQSRHEVLPHVPADVLEALGLALLLYTPQCPSGQTPSVTRFGRAVALKQTTSNVPAKESSPHRPHGRAAARQHLARLADRLEPGRLDRPRPPQRWSASDCVAPSDVASCRAETSPCRHRSLTTAAPFARLDSPRPPPTASSPPVARTTNTAAEQRRLVSAQNTSPSTAQTQTHLRRPFPSPDPLRSHRRSPPNDGACAECSGTRTRRPPASPPPRPRTFH